MWQASDGGVIDVRVFLGFSTAQGVTIQLPVDTETKEADALTLPSG